MKTKNLHWIACFIIAIPAKYEEAILVLCPIPSIAKENMVGYTIDKKNQHQSKN